MSFYRAEHEHYTGLALGRVSENFALDGGGELRATGDWIWIAWRRTGAARSGVATDRYDAEDALELAMDELAGS